MQNLDLAVDDLIARQPWLLDLYRRRPRKGTHLCPWCSPERFARIAAEERAAVSGGEEGRR
ncbi:hypothetical protein [Catellatospora vulcania]|uniref:hypothetical protein n=1 Tax=Catellatospora vulcania TaxID=1460450 RepID=UPI0012D39D0A|nr:hypothetical protein [Catellatospora vulcania]